MTTEPTTGRADRAASTPPADLLGAAPLLPARRCDRAPSCRPGFAAGATTAGIKASGRPDLAVIRDDRRPGVGRGRLHDEPGRGGARSRPPGRTWRSPAPRAAAAAPTTSAAPRPSSRRAAAPTPRPGLAGLADQVAIAEAVAVHLGVDPLGRPQPLHRASSGRGSRSTKVAVGIVEPRPPPASPTTDAGLLAAAEALRTTDTVTKMASASVDLPGPDGAPAAGHRLRHRQGRRDDPPADGDDARGRPDRRRRRARRRSTGCSARRRCGPGTSSRSTATRARTTRSSCSPPARPPAAPVLPGTAEAATLGRRDRGRRPVARPPAGGRRRGGDDPDHLPGLRRPRRRRRPGGRPGGRSPAASSRPPPTAATRTGAGSPAPPGTPASARSASSRWPGSPTPTPAPGPARPPSSTPTGCGSRSPATSSTTGRPAARSPSTAPRRGPRWTRPRSSSASTWASAPGTGEAFGCDLTEQYVIENAEYTT